MMNRQWMSVVLLGLATPVFAQGAVIKPFDESLMKIARGELIAFAAIGDYGNNSDDEKRVANLVGKRAPNFVITLGDNNYTYGCWDTIDKNIGKYYSNFIGNYKGEYGRGSAENKFFPSLGNHDWNARGKCEYKGDLPYLSYFTLPNNGRYYDFRKGSVHFFAIDSDSHEPDGNKEGSKQYQWLKEKIKASDACFKVVYFHHPAYSSGEHGSNKDMQWDFKDLGADVVMAGHDHGYERIERDDILYYVNGAGGASLYDFDRKVDGSKYRYDKKHGYMMGYAHDNRFGLVFFNDKDRIKDGVTLVKDCQ